jgi:hypothetical protein
VRSDVWPWARLKMTPSDRAEVAAAEPRGAFASIGYNPRTKRFSTTISGAVTGTVQVGYDVDSPIASFRAAYAQIATAEPVEIRSVLA